MKTISICALMIFLVQSLTAFATPYPGMGTSVLVDPQLGLFLTSRGYQVKTEGTQWIAVADPEQSLLESVHYQLKIADNKTSSASLALKIDEMGSAQKLDQYAKKWIKEYSQFGFEILGSQNTQISGQNSLVIDLIQKNQTQQIRQVLIQNKQKIAIFTCRDQKAEFTKTLPACNQVMRSFRWL